MSASSIIPYVYALVRVMILVRFAISIFALALLGLALSLSATQGKQDRPVDAGTATITRG